VVGVLARPRLVPPLSPSFSRAAPLAATPEFAATNASAFFAIVGRSAPETTLAFSDSSATHQAALPNLVPTAIVWALMIGALLVYTKSLGACIIAHAVTNLLLAVVLFTFLFMTSGGKATTTVEEVVQGRPAAQAGLRPGDRIVAINGTAVEASEIAKQISDHDKEFWHLLAQRVPLALEGAASLERSDAGAPPSRAAA